MRVLVVEDDPTIGLELVEGLTQEGFHVVLATDGQAGLLAASDDHFDVIILDLLLPKMNGYRVIEEIRVTNETIPILVLTAKSGEHDVADVLVAGADDFVSKPFSYVELVARLHNLITRSSRAQRKKLQTSDLVLDPAAHSVHRGDTAIGLTPTEFKILERLLSAKPAVVTQQEFFDEIWDPASPPDPNIIQLYVGYIRRKIDHPFGTTTITTHRGVGYQITDE